MPLILAAILCCTINGQVHAPSGQPLASASVTLRGATVTATTTDARGEFSVHTSPGRYELDARASGYGATSVGPIDVRHDSKVDVTLEPLDTPALRIIGSVRVDGRLAIQRHAVPTIDISRADLQRTGSDLVVQGLAPVPSVTFSQPDGGAPTAVSAVALRGPDPSETLVALDGQILNDGNTGDLDLSRFPSAAFSNLDLTEGLGPADSEGSNTIGGAVNLISLRPTQLVHSAMSFSGGSFGTSEGWYNVTGSRDKLGYAFALDDQQQHGFVDQTQTVCAPGDTSSCAPTHLGSTISSRLALANVLWNFSQSSDVGVRVFSLGNARDISSTINGIDDHPGSSTFGQLIGPGAATFTQSVRAYQLYGRTGLGAGSLQTAVSLSDNNVGLEGENGGISPYDVAHADKRSTVEMAWGRTFENSEFAFGGYTRYETLSEAGVTPDQSQNIQSYFLRGAINPVRRLRLSGGLYVSHYTTFGGNLDGRFAASYDVDANSAVRFSAGTGFRAPLLIERYVFPNDALPPPDANCVIAGQGNPNETPEHATEYELGYSHVFPAQANLDVSLYRTNLRNPIENFYPLNTFNPGCANVYYSYPINIGNAVYEGAEVRFQQRFDRQHLFMTLQYGLNVAYPENLGATVSNPTSGGNLVDGQQFLGIPQQVGSVELDWQNHDWHASTQAIFRGNNNELGQNPFNILNAAIGKSFGKLDLTLAGTNLLDNVAGPYTLAGGGVPYRGIVDFAPGNVPVYGSLPTDRLFIDPAAVRLILTLRN
ncbi:MAG: TonB-dependent receptor [Vulcanimicrobiaceae bacterium]